MSDSSDPVSGVYVRMSDDVQGLLAENDVSLLDLLKSEGIQARVAAASDPASDASVGTKEPITLVLATAAAIAALTPVLTRAINAISRRPVVVRETVLAPVESSSGEIVKSSTGKPILSWVERTRVISRQQPASSEQSSMTIETPLGIDLTLESSSNVG